MPVVKSACNFNFQQDFNLEYSTLEIQTQNVKEEDHSDVTRDILKSCDDDSTEGGSKKINEDDENGSVYMPSESEHIERARKEAKTDTKK